MLWLVGNFHQMARERTSNLILCHRKGRVYLQEGMSSPRFSALGSGSQSSKGCPYRPHTGLSGPQQHAAPQPLGPLSSFG